MHSPAYAAPQGGQVSAGQATISQQQLTTDIHQSSQNAVINWQKFDIQPNETVNFHQPNAQSITLNRVVGNEESAIRGAMNANGKVFISNPNGVLIGKEAQINVGSLVATTQNIKDDDLMNNRLNFNGQAGGKVENNANIRVPKGGVIALIAPIVKNSGKLTASEGAVLLASAEQFRITLPKDNFSYTLDRGTLQGLVDNQGAILADGGRVVLTAKGIDAVKKSVIKHSGTIEANTVSNKNGVVELLGDLDHSELQMTGSIKAEGKGTQQGGQVETSAAKLKISEKANVSTKSEKGKTGKWTIDSKDFTVAKSGGDMSGQAVSNALRNNNVELKSRNGAKEGKGDVIINDEISWDKNTLTLNAENDIHINKTLNGSGTAKLALEYGQGSANGGEADYYLDKNTPLASRTVKVNLPEGKNFTTKKGAKGEVVEFDVIHRMPEIVRNTSESWNEDWKSQFTASNIAFGKDIDLSHTANYQGFAGWYVPKNDNNNLPVRIEGLGHQADNLTLASKKNLQPTGLFTRMHNDLGTIRNIGVTNMNISSEGTYADTGGLVGSGGRNITNSYATGSVTTSEQYADAGGLVGSGHDITNSYATGSVTTLGEHAYAGGLVGSGQDITNSYATGSVTTLGEHAYAGGLVGVDGFNITNSYATGSVTTSRGSAGGLVGQNGRNISNSYASGSVTSGDAPAGGLVGNAGYNITNSYATGSVTTSGWGSNAGGLVGYNGQDITNSYATGRVATSGNNANAGGVLGEKTWWTSESSPNITNTYFNMNQVSSEKGKVSRYGTGVSEQALKQKSTFVGWDFDTVWRIDEGRDYPRLRALTEGKIEVTPEKTEAGITANNLSKTYDGEAVNTEADLAKLDGWNGTGYTVSGLKEGDSVASIFNGGLTFNGARSTWKGAVNAGEYVLDPTADLTEAAKQKYEIVWNTGKLTINKRPISLIGTKEYNGNPLIRAKDFIRINGLVDKDKSLAYGTDDKLLADTLSGTATAGGKDARDEFYRLKEVSGLSLKEALAKNYEINPANSLVQITPRILNLEISKTYDGSSIFDNGFNLGNGLSVNSTTLTVTNVLDNDKVNLSSRGLSVNGVNAGIYKRLKSGVIESDNPNYVYHPTKSQIRAEVKPRALSLEGSKIYDGTKIVTSKHVTKLNGVVNELDRLEILKYLQGEGTLNSENVAGEKLLVNSSFKLAKDLISPAPVTLNYIISPLASRWAIKSRAVIVNGEKEYDGTTLIQTGNAKFSFANLADKEKQDGSLLTIISGTGRIASENVSSKGNYLVNKLNLKLGGGSANNYHIIDSSSPEFNSVANKGDGWKITPKPLHIKVSKLEDGNTKFTRRFELTNLISRNNQVDDVQVSGVISAKDSKVGKKIAFESSTSRLVLSGKDAENYIVPPFDAKYISAEILVDKNKPVEDKPSNRPVNNQPAITQPVDKIQNQSGTSAGNNLPTVTKPLDKAQNQSGATGNHQPVENQATNKTRNQSGQTSYTPILITRTDADRLSQELNVQSRGAIRVQLDVPSEWENSIGAFGNDSTHFVNGAARFSDINQIGNKTEVANFVVNLRKEIGDNGRATELTNQYVDGLPEMNILDGNWLDNVLGNANVTINDTIRNIIKTNYLVKTYNNSTQYDERFTQFYSLYLSDSQKLHSEMERKVHKVNELINEANNPKGVDWKTSLSNSFKDSAGLMLDGANAGVTVSKYILPTGSLDKVTESISTLTHNFSLLTNTGDMAKGYMDVIGFASDKLPTLLSTISDIGSKGAIEPAHISNMIDVLNSFAELNGKNANDDLAVTGNLNSILDSIKTLKDSEEFIREMNYIPDDLLSYGDKKVFSSLIRTKQIFSALDILLKGLDSAVKQFPVLGSASGVVEGLNDVKSVVQPFLKGSNERTVNARYESINAKAQNMQKSIEDAINIRSMMMRDTLINAGKVGVKSN